jgi:hypothetical protein
VYEPVTPVLRAHDFETPAKKEFGVATEHSGLEKAGVERSRPKLQRG